MSSVSKGAQPPRGAQPPKGAQPQKGVQPVRCSVIKRASAEVIQAMKLPVPSGQLQVAPQSFYGTPAPPISEAQKKVKEMAKENPLLMPGVGPLLSSLASPSLAGPSLPAAPLAKKKALRFIKETPDFSPRHREIPVSTLADFERVVGDGASTVAMDYITKQKDIETNNPYLTDTVIYTPQSRRSFHRFIQDNFWDTFHLDPQIKGSIDEDACAKLDSAAGDAVEAFLYQKFIREYIRNAGPYRGILVYHGLGSGKTCSAIAAAEALYGTSNKKIIVMTPFSLRGNFMSEISFCGFRHFNLHNHWVREPLASDAGITYTYAKSVLSLRDEYLKRVLRRPDEEHRSIWIPDFTKPPNYNSPELQEFRNDIREQLTEMIDSRIKFISYNGISGAELKRYACQIDPVTQKREFDDAIIVIDEFHNLTRLMQGSITPYIQQRKGKKRKIEVEPIVPGRWQPTLCNKPMNYERAYLFYRLLTDARNSKIIGLSGTPIINFPDELGIIANVLSGYTECVEISLLSADKTIIEQCRAIAETESRIDIIRFRAGDRKMDVLLSTFIEGYEKVIDPENVSNFIGVKYNKDAQEGIREIYPRIKAKWLAANLPIGAETYVSYPRLPIDDETFKREFINPADLSIINRIVLQKRLTGLISYYKGSKEEYMPRVVRDEEVECEMSDHVLASYSKERIVEIRRDVGKDKDTGDVFAAVEMFAKMKNPSSYRFRSRAICNFAFPKGIVRPFPTTKQDELSEVAAEPATAILTESEMNSEEDMEAAAAVALEEEHVVQPDEDDKKEDNESADELQKELEEVAQAEAQEEVAQEEAQEEAVPKKGGAKPPRIVRPSIAAASAAPVAVPVAAPVVAAPSEPSILESIGKAVSSAVDAVIPEKSDPQEEVLEEEPDAYQALSYVQRVDIAMRKLDEAGSTFLQLDAADPVGRLYNYSPKLDHMIRRINSSKGSNLVYSQFKTVEGLGVLGCALKANHFVEIELTGSETNPSFTPATERSLRKGPQAKEKRFIKYTGEGSKLLRTHILNLFNGKILELPSNMQQVLIESGYAEQQNKYGDICWVIGITGAGAEGISLKCCRSVHIMEPYWNNVRLEQVKGRAIRICSHKDLPFKDREVEIYTYYSVFSEEQKRGDRIDVTIRDADKDRMTGRLMTSDENVFYVSKRKDKINQEILNVMKESAVDCNLNAADNDGIQCINLYGRPDQYLFDPNLEVDKIITSTDFKEEVQKVDVQGDDVVERIAKELGTSIRTSSAKVNIPVCTFRKVRYLLQPKKDAGGLVFNMFAETDTDFRNVLGEVGINPATGTFKGAVPRLK